jgi:hypothetical protein
LTRRRSIALAATAVLIVGGVLLWLNWPRDEPTRTSVDEAVASFRHDEASGGDRSEGPPPGVYRYATSGGESADTAITSTTHDYRGVSTIVRGPGRCGELERWQVLAERWTETETCPGPDGDELVGVHEYHEFYGVAQDDSFHCDGDPVTIPPRAQPGFHFSDKCRSDDSTVVNDSRLVGFGPLRVGGKTFPAVHTITDSRIEGSSSGSSRRDDWRRQSDGLLLRRSAQSSVESGTLGGTHYVESYALRLLDIEPRR